MVDSLSAFVGRFLYNNSRLSGPLSAIQASIFQGLPNPMKALKTMSGPCIGCELLGKGANNGVQS